MLPSQETRTLVSAQAPSHRPLSRRLARIPRRLRRLVRPSRARAQGNPRDLQRGRLLRLLPREAVCAEIGSWKGDFAAEILSDRSPRTLYLVDPWEHRQEQEYEGAWYGGTASGQDQLDAVHDSVLARFAAEIDSGQVVVVRRRSLDAAGAFADASLDWVYIDGDHRYEGVKADLEAYYSKVKPGGWLAGDDYGYKSGWFEDGVTRAVDEFAPGRGELKIIGTQFLLHKRAS